MFGSLKKNTYLCVTKNNKTLTTMYLTKKQKTDGFDIDNKRIYRPKVEKHPLKDSYMVFLRYSNLPPYFGSLNKCQKACEHLTNKLLEEGYTFID